MSVAREHPHRAGRWDWIVFLATGPEENLEAFAWDAGVELFDRRKQTIRCRAHGDDRGIAAYNRAVEAAKKHDVTIQDLVTRRGALENTSTVGSAKVDVYESIEEYPIVHLGTHGMRYGNNLPPTANESSTEAVGRR